MPLHIATADRRAVLMEERGQAEVTRLIEAALEIIGGSATAELSVRDVVAAAGLSNAVFYRHFLGKDELLLGIVDFGQRTLVEYLSEQMAHADTPPDRVAVWVHGMLDQASPSAARPTRPFVLDLPRLYSRFPTEMQAAADAVISPLAAAVAAAALPGEPSLGVALTYDLVEGALQRHLLRETVPDAGEREAIVAYVLSALGLAGQR